MDDLEWMKELEGFKEHDPGCEDEDLGFTDYFQQDWKVFDTSEDMEVFNCQLIRGYSEMLEEETDIATVWGNDIDIEEQMDNLSLMTNAPKMWRLLVRNKEFFESTGEIFQAKQIEKLLNEILKQTVIHERENQ